MKTKITGLFKLLMIVLSLSSCQKVAEYYVGLNLQPNMSKSEFTPGLNVFGILKTGPGFDTINHYFEVQQLLSIQNMLDSIMIEDAVINLKRVLPTGEEQNYLPQHKSNGVYFDTTIVTAPGDKWLYSCKYDSAIVTSECQIPNIPLLLGEIEVLAENGFKFTIQSDSSVYLYQVYLLNGENFLIEKKIPNKGSNTTFTLNPNWSVNVGTNLISVFAYDKNLENYISTSNTFFKPNAFRPSFSTVTGGFGTFGAVSSNLFTISN